MLKGKFTIWFVLLFVVLMAVTTACGEAVVTEDPTPDDGDEVLPEKNALEVAATTFTTELIEPIDPAAVADIPGPVSGFHGYESMEGDWLKLPEASSLTGKKVALTVMGLGQPFFLAISGHWEEFAEFYDFELRVFDGRFDAGTVQSNVEDIIAWGPDAVAFAPLDSDASVAQVQRIKDEGIAVITYNVEPREKVSPRVIADHYNGCRLVGQNLGLYYKEMFGDKPAIIGVVDLPQLPQVIDRKNGFYYGFLSVVPDATIGQTVDGGGVIDQANPAATDLIQANPDMNVIFGINNDSSLGTMRALQAAGKWNAQWGALASVDGSAPVMVELGNPNTPYKAESGYPPYDFSVAPFILLGMAYDGLVDEYSQVVLSYPPVLPTAEGIKEWVDVQYPSR